MSYDSINIDDALDLEMGFSEEEVQNAISNLRKEKAPALDGFNIASVSYTHLTLPTKRIV